MTALRGLYTSSPILLVLLLPVLSHAQEVRPICDSIGFCWRPEEMNALIQYLDAHADVRAEGERKGQPVAAISVHDDYLYAGRVYHPLYRNLRVKEAVIFGVTHGSVTRELGPMSGVVILDEYAHWRGPYGVVQISPLRSILRRQLPPEEVLISNRAHALEHSIEALIPFLQHYNRDIRITPIMVTRMPMEQMQDLAQRLSEIFAGYIAEHHLEPGKDIVFLMSSDANHYGPDFNNVAYGIDAEAHRIATENDRRIISEYLAGEISSSRIEGLAREIWPDSTSKNPIPLWCGRYPITLGLLTVSDLMSRLGRPPLYGTLLKYSDSFSEGVLPVRNTSMGVTAVFSYRHWCGWFTEAFNSAK